MVLGMSLQTFTLVHVLISLAGIASGLAVMYGFLTKNRVEVAGETAIEHAVKRVHLIDTLAGENALAVEVLVDVGYRTSVDVEAGLAGIDVGQTRTAGALHAYANTRLENAIAGGNNVSDRIDDGAIQGMRHGADHALGGTAGQLSVG